MTEDIKYLADAIEAKGLKVVFGLEAQGHIKTIEDELARWDADMFYCVEVWRIIGRKIGWCPFTAAMDYMRYKNKPNNIMSKETLQEAKRALNIADAELRSMYASKGVVGSTALQTMQRASKAIDTDLRQMEQVERPNTSKGPFVDEPLFTRTIIVHQVL